MKTPEEAAAIKAIENEAIRLNELIKELLAGVSESRSMLIGKRPITPEYVDRQLSVVKKVLGSTEGIVSALNVLDPDNSGEIVDNQNWRTNPRTNTPQETAQNVRSAKAVTGAAPAPAPPQRMPAKFTTQKTEGGISQTEEQRAIVECKHQNIAINAFAGTGKTSTLVEYAKARPNAKILYLAFNQAVAAEAKRKFPANVDARTSHSLAFQQFGKPYAHKLGDPRARDVLDVVESGMRIPAVSTDEKYQFVQFCLKRVHSFFASGGDSYKIVEPESARHVLTNGRVIDPADVTAGAQLVWEAMCDKENVACKLPHDAYLKMYQLSGPNLERFDHILLDEGQDTNMSLFSIFKSQTNVGKAVVGDRHQGIYSFRGAQNVMDKLPKAKRLVLTNSFRFGKPIANVANAILEVFCQEKLKLNGAGRIEMPEHPSKAHLTRTNAGLFSFAVGWLEAQRRNGRPAQLHLVGGVEKYQLDLITDTFYLYTYENSKIQDFFLRKFRSFDELEKYADAVNDRELLARIKIVDTYQNRIPELVDLVKRSHYPVEQAGISITTAHKAKGLEWHEVSLGGDFPNMMSADEMPLARAFSKKGDSEEGLLALEEANLLYVASTRAMCVLHPNGELAKFMEWHSQHSGNFQATNES